MQGNLAESETKFIPIHATAPAVEAGGKVDGQITMTAKIGDVEHRDSFAIRVFGEDKKANGRLALVDPDGTTGKMLANLGYRTSSWEREVRFAGCGRPQRFER